jgi:ubiquinone/menaquinone biosynthesis C-methylase UbiE
MREACSVDERTLRVRASLDGRDRPLQAFDSGAVRPVHRPALVRAERGIRAKRVARLQPAPILETAAGTGIVTRAVKEELPAAEVVATDINPAVVAFAKQQCQSDGVSFQAADAQQLPFDDESFDLVLCLFGIMFVPDKVRANEEARRVLRPGGQYVLVTFNRLDLNPVPRAAGEAVATLFPEAARSIRSRARDHRSRAGAPTL